MKAYAVASVVRRPDGVQELHLYLVEASNVDAAESRAMTRAMAQGRVLEATRVLPASFDDLAPPDWRNQ